MLGNPGYLQISFSFAHPWCFWFCIFFSYFILFYFIYFFCAQLIAILPIFLHLFNHKKIIFNFKSNIFFKILKKIINFQLFRKLGFQATVPNCYLLYCNQYIRSRAVFLLKISFKWETSEHWEKWHETQVWPSVSALKMTCIADRYQFHPTENYRPPSKNINSE